MSKIIVKCKDKTSSRWLASQNKSVIGDIPVSVIHTDEVTKLLRAGVIEQVELQEFENYHKKAAKSTEDKLALYLEVFDTAIESKDIEAASKQLEKMKRAGLKGTAMKRVNGRYSHLKRVLEEDAIKKERLDLATELVDESIELDLFELDKNEMLCLGSLRLGKEAEEIVAWASKNDDNIKIIQDALVEKKKTNSGDNPE